MDLSLKREYIQNALATVEAGGGTQDRWSARTFGLLMGEKHDAMLYANTNNLNEDGTPNTAHSLNPVPFVYVTANKDAKVENGVLADVAPSILHILGMEQPAEMTGKDLIK
jgi:hypothetical protein